MMILHCKSIVKLRTSENWKKQLQRTWVLVISPKDLFKSEKVNIFRKSSGLSSYYVLDLNLNMLDMAFGISYTHALVQFSKRQPQFLINSYARN